MSTIRLQVFDKNGDGSISAREICAVLGSVGEKITIEEAHKMVKSVDLDDNDEIDYSEFKKMMQDAPPKSQ